MVASGCPQLPGCASSLPLIIGFWIVLSATSTVSFLVMMLPQDLAHDTLFAEVTESQSNVKNTLEHTLSLLHTESTEGCPRGSLRAQGSHPVSLAMCFGAQGSHPVPLATYILGELSLTALLVLNLQTPHGDGVKRVLACWLCQEACSSRSAGAGGAFCARRGGPRGLPGGGD